MMIAALFLLVAGASAAPFLRVPVNTLFGPSGYVTPDGVQVQFTAEEADNIAVVGPSGVVTKDGRNVQFYVPRTKRSTGWTMGASGAIGPNGELVQFKEANTVIVADGPSGTIFSDGTLVQKRAKRSATTPYGNIVGASGIITKNGRTIQLPMGVSVVLDGPSGIVLSNGQNIQLA